MCDKKRCMHMSVIFLLIFSTLLTGCDFFFDDRVDSVGNFDSAPASGVGSESSSEPTSEVFYDSDTMSQQHELIEKPTSIYPMSVNTYHMLYNFRIGFLSGTMKSLFQIEDNPEQNDQVSMIAGFSFKDFAAMDNSLYCLISYVNELDCMEGYFLETDSVLFALEKIYSMEILSAKKDDPTEEDLKMYGLDKDVYFITFDCDPAIENGVSEESQWVKNSFLISQRTSNGTHYVYLSLHDMIVEVDHSCFSFLDWEEYEWYRRAFFQNHISYMKDMSVTVGEKTYDFVFDNRFSYAYYDNGDGTGVFLDFSKGTLTEASDGTFLYTVTQTGRQHNVYFVDLSQLYRDPTTGKMIYQGSGDTGTVKVIVAVDQSKYLQIISPQYCGEGGLINYVISEEEIVDGEVVTKIYTATDNFRRLYTKLLLFAIEGNADLSVCGGDVAAYVEATSPIASVTYSMEDRASVFNPEHFENNNKRDVVIRFYTYPNGKLFFTIQSDDADENGMFYATWESLNDLDVYLEDFMNGVLIPQLL